MPPTTDKLASKALWGLLILIAGLVGVSHACGSGASVPSVPSPLRPEFQTAAAAHDALALSDELEALIDHERDTEVDRRVLYALVRRWPKKTAAYAYARASLAGRLVQSEGWSEAALIGEVEKWARYSIGYNPRFRHGAATRMLGSLYALAPASLLKHGDSERGVELLEELHEKHPLSLENNLRLAEAYLALNDPEAASAGLCQCLRAQKSMRLEHQRLVKRLLDQVGRSELDCGRANP